MGQYRRCSRGAIERSKPEQCRREVRRCTHRMDEHAMQGCKGVREWCGGHQLLRGVAGGAHAREAHLAHAMGTIGCLF